MSKRDVLRVKLLASLCFVSSGIAFSLSIAGITTLLGVYDYRVHLAIVIVAPPSALLFTVQSVKGQDWQRKMMAIALALSLSHLFEWSGEALLIFGFNILAGIAALYLSVSLSKIIIEKNALES